MPADPIRHLYDGGGFEGAGGGDVDEGVVEARSEGRAGGAISRSRKERGGRASRRHLAKAKIGVIEVAADQVAAVGGGVGSGWNKRWGRRSIRDVGEVEERAGKESKVSHVRGVWVWQMNMWEQRWWEREGPR